MILSAVFVTAVALQTTFHSPEKILSNLRSMPKTFSFPDDLAKAYDRVPCGKLWGVLRVYGADGRLLLHGSQVTVFLLRLLCPCRES